MTEIEIGKEYRLLPGSTNDGGRRSTLANTGTTRVRVESGGPDDDGDYIVVALDGDTGLVSYLFEQSWFVHGDFLAPLDDQVAAKPEPETLSPAEVIAKALDGAYVAQGSVWVKAEVKYGPNGACAVVVTLDPDVGYTAQYSLVPKEV